MTLSDRLLQGVEELEKDFYEVIHSGKIDRIVEEARTYGFQLRTQESASVLNRMIERGMEALHRVAIRNQGARGEDIEAQEKRVGEMIQLLDSAEKWGFRLSIEEPQDLIGEILSQRIENLEVGWWGGNTQGDPLPPKIAILAEKLGFNVEKLSTIVSPAASQGH